MKKLTLKAFKDLTKDMPDDTLICVPIEAGKEWTLKGIPNFIHLAPVEHSYGNENTITIGQAYDMGDELIVKKLVDKNTWDVIG